MAKIPKQAPFRWTVSEPRARTWRMTACAFLLLCFNDAYGASETLTLPNSQERVQISTYPPSPEEVAAGLAVVNSFLDALNRGDVAAAWSKTANELRARTNEEEWRAMIDRLFSNAGQRGTSQFEMVVKTSALPTGISGDIMIFALVTQFEKLTLEETITLIKNGDDWRMLSYNWRRRSTPVAFGASPKRHVASAV